MPALAEPATDALPEPERRHRRVRELLSLLERLTAAPGVRERLDALERLARWVTTSDRTIPLATGDAVAPPWRRLAALLGVLARMPALREQVAATVAAVLAQAGALGLLAGSGLPSDRGIAQETTERLFRRLLPAPRDEHDLARALLRLFPSRRELRWLEEMPPALFHQLAGDLAAAPGAAAPLLAAAADAVCLVSARVQALGLSEAIRTRSEPAPLRESPFHALPRRSDELLAQIEAGRRGAAEREWRLAADRCRQAVAAVLSHLESTGVSVDVVYGLDVIEQSLARLEALLAVLLTAPGAERDAAAHRLLVTLVRRRQADRSLRDLMGANLRLLARKIIDRAGQTGEHYITYTRRDYAGMVLSAMGGGVLTTGTAAAKIAIAAGHFALFVEGFLSGTNYALSFVLMQLMGFTLATKQPSMTAAALAAAIGGGSEPGRLDELVAQVARICRSQLAAALGNISAVTVGALALDAFWRWRHGHAFVGAEKATAVFASLDPARSGTVFFAALTGVILWLSSLAGGWIENFAVYHRLPQALAEHRAGRLIGERATRWFADSFARNVSGIGSSVALGFMLGMCPVLGKFVGLPIDVRHVTLSTGTLVLAVSSVGRPSTSVLLGAAGGIAIIFALNLGVSFMLALAVAMRAREVPVRDRLRLAAALARRFLTHPGEFLLPPPRGAKAPHAHH